MRSGRRLKGSTRDTAPTLIVGVGAVVSAAPWDTPHGSTPHVLDSITFTHSRRTAKGWQSPKSATFGGWRDAWDYLDALGTSGRRVYVVAPRASDVLTLMHFWDRVRDGEVSIWDDVARRRGRDRTGAAERSRQRHPLVMSGRPDIIGYSTSRASFRWVSVTNWCDMSMADLFRSVGQEPPADAEETDKWEYHRWPSELVSRAVLRYMQRLTHWWTSNGCGAWKDTPGGAAWSSFLRRGDVDRIIQHEDENAAKLEDAACWGGRVAAWYFGPIGDPDKWHELADPPPPRKGGFGLSGPIHRYDVRAMYPSILRDERMPCVLIRTDTRPNLRSLSIGLRELLAVARVRVRTDRAVYPFRFRGRTCYPVGRFDTTLATPELVQAMKAGELESVHTIAWYTPGTPFRVWASWVLSLRDAMKAGGDAVGEKLVKLLANSLTGRLSKRRIGWDDCPRAIPLLEWGEWMRDDGRETLPSLYRSVGGHVQVMNRDGGRPHTLAAVYAHITSYGRVRMNRVRELAGDRHVVWQDTDGVLVTDTGRDRIDRAAGVVGGRYGDLRREGTHHAGQIYTPKHYWLDGQWTLAGVHSGFAVTGGTHAHDVVTTNPARQAIDPSQAAVFRSVRHIDIAAIDPGITLGGDHWCIPPEVWKGDRPARSPVGQLLIDTGEWP